MHDKIEKIRELLSELEEQNPGTPSESSRILSGLELPDIVRDVVDFLIPSLKPYEAAFYWYLLRHSILESGNQLLRASTRRLQSGVLRSAYADTSKGSKEVTSGSLSYGTVADTLRSLEEIGAIRREGDPNQDGTLYRVLLPEEIPLCKTARSEKNKLLAPKVVEESEVDYYNIRENRAKIFERDNYVCRHCSKQLTRFTATLDHLQAVANGGDNSFDNLVTACLDCNSRKNSRLLSDFTADENSTR
jgi:5-methylcytosine-specific restriction endonuclease McrA